jgi:hypothetical protein
MKIKILYEPGDLVKVTKAPDEENYLVGLCGEVLEARSFISVKLTNGNKAWFTGEEIEPLDSKFLELLKHYA